MNADDKSKLKAYEELIGSLEHTNGLQHRVIETISAVLLRKPGRWDAPYATNYNFDIVS